MNRSIIIAVAGGSASGKTTVVNEIRDALANEDIVIIKHDDYYRDQSDKTMEERKRTNYDHPSSLENELLIQHLKELLNGNSINKPNYDFVEQTRSKEYTLVNPAKVIILDGILVLEDERIRELCDIKVFVECDEDLRLIRRIKRDMVERGRSEESITKQFYSTVKPMHDIYIEPHKVKSDFLFDNDNDNGLDEKQVEKLVNLIREKM